MAKRSARTVWLNNVCTLTVSVIASLLQVCGGKRFWGLSCKDHGIKPWKSGVTACKKFSRYTEVINLRFPHRGTASLAQVSTMGLCPLPESKMGKDSALRNRE